MKSDGLRAVSFLLSLKEFFGIQENRRQLYTLESAGFGGGRIFSGSNGVLSAHYQITDHLGSVRVAFTDKHTVLSRNDYYAYGKRHVNSRLRTVSDDSNRFLFNGKEAQTTGELGLLDYGASMYSPEFVRFRNMDILIEEFPHQSPFVYADNNPVRFIDFMGMSAESPDSMRTVNIEPVVVTAQDQSATIPTWYYYLDQFTSFWGGPLNDLTGTEKNFANNLSATVDFLMLAFAPQTFLKPTATVSRNTTVSKVKTQRIKAPKGWITKATKNGNGVMHQDPHNLHNSIRVMRGNPNSPNPALQRPYVKFQKNGSAYDVNGHKLPNGDLPEAHIPLNDFDINKMPKFD